MTPPNPAIIPLLNKIGIDPDFYDPGEDQPRDWIAGIDMQIRFAQTSAELLAKYLVKGPGTLHLLFWGIDIRDFARNADYFGQGAKDILDLDENLYNYKEHNQKKLREIHADAWDNFMRKIYVIPVHLCPNFDMTKFPPDELDRLGLEMPKHGTEYNMEYLAE